MDSKTTITHATIGPRLLSPRRPKPSLGETGKSIGLTTRRGSLEIPGDGEKQEQSDDR
jgi:hypothetical protein